MDPTYNTLLGLHRDLLYPMTVGAIVIGFAQSVIVRGGAEDNFLWLFSALWFVIYFAIAFLALPQTKPRQFGKVSFLANLAELGLIVAVGCWFGLLYLPDRQEFQFTSTYLIWLIIPVTAGISNWFSGRPVRTALSVAAILIASIGLVEARNSSAGYTALLGLMYVLLAIYVCAAVTGRPSNILGLDLKR